MMISCYTSCRSTVGQTPLLYIYRRVTGDIRTRLKHDKNACINTQVCTLHDIDFPARRVSTALRFFNMN